MPGMRKIVSLGASLILVIGAIISAVGPDRAQAQTSQRCFPETGFCIDGRIREFWEQNGGLPVFGFPIGPQQQETIEGKTLQVQRFERNRLELHPENARPYDVLLGRLGADRLAQLGKDWQTYPKSGDQSGCRYFAETGQSVCGTILRAWRASGLEIDGRAGKSESESLALFGLPLSPLVTERQADGQERQVQWFERARFEVHPENQPPYDVLLGLLGNEIRDGGKPPAPAPDACADVKDPVSARIRPGKCVKKGTQLEIDIFGFQPNEQVGFWLTAPDGWNDGTVETVTMTSSGAVNGLEFDTSDIPAPGIWYLVFEGVSSKHQSIIYFKVIDEAAAQPAAPSAPGVLPASQNALVEPERGPRGTEFMIGGWGFAPDEQVGVYATAPDRSVYGAPFQVTADSDGIVVVSFTALEDIPTGVWANTFEGVESGRKAIAYFEVTP
jgi:hypothetical protein